MKKNRIFLTALLALALVSAAFAQTEKDFNVTLTEDGKGVVITGYTGTATAVRIPATIQGMPVRMINDEAFRRKSTITSVIIPAGVTHIGNSAFFWCPKLTSVTIPEGVTYIDDFAFASCPLTAITLPKSLKTLGDSAFSGVRITTLTLPNGLERISKYAFQGCFALTTVTLPASITQIDSGAFRECDALTTVTIPDSVETIEFVYNSAFIDCPKLSLASQAALRKRGYTGRF